MKRPILKFFFLFILGLITLISCEKDDEAQNNAPEIKDQSFDASEDITDADIIGEVIADDVDDDELTYSITTNSVSMLTKSGEGRQVVVPNKDLFQINNEGKLKLKNGKNLDYEKSTKHEIVVEVSDGELTASATITINVIDVDENSKPVINDQSFTIAENSALGSTVGNIVATDPDGDDLVYFWSSGQDNNDALKVFKLDDNTIKTVETNNHGKLNYEATSSYTFDITVGDGKLSTRTTITVNIADENDAPTFGKDGNVTVAASESTGDTEDILNLPATDEDGDALTYSIKNDVDNLFMIKDGGRIELQSGKSLDYETKTIHSFTAVVTDPDGASESVNVTVNVTDEDDTPLSGINVVTLAGSNRQGNTNGTGVDARFFIPSGVTLDASSNVIVADTENQMLRKVTSIGEASYFAKGDITNPFGIVSGGNGIFYVSDLVRESIYKVTTNGSTVTSIQLFAGTRGSGGLVNGDRLSAKFHNPFGMAIDDDGDLYVADGANHVIRKINTTTGVVSTFAGTGTAGIQDGDVSTANFNNPTDVAFDSQGNLLVVDRYNHRIRKISPSGMVSTLAGSTQGDADGTGSAAMFKFPYMICVTNTNKIFVTDNQNHKIKKITPSGEVTTYAGSTNGYADGDGTVAKFNQPVGIYVDINEILYVSDRNSIRKVHPVME